MPAFARDQHRFFCQGLHLASAQDTMPEGKWPVLQNVRSYQQGTLQPRLGHVVMATLGGTPVHTLARLVDPTGLPALPRLILAGMAATVYLGTDGGPFISTLAGFSGNPLCVVSLQPPNSPSPWFYVADSVKLRKFSADRASYPVGIASPAFPPDLELFTIGINLISDFYSLSGWTSVGTAAGVLGGAYLRTDTTIDVILYDNGTTGNASIVPVNIDQIGEGMIVTLNGVDDVQVNEITVAIAPTTIASIIYDVGTSGECTIQPTASLGTGQLFSPKQSLSTEGGGISSSSAVVQSIIEHTTPLATSGLPNPFLFDASKPARRIRQSDFPVNSIVVLGGTETVRITSVATGPDEVQSFRCSTTLTHAAGETVTGRAAFRSWVPNTYTTGMTIEDRAVTNVITLPPLVDPATTSTATAGIISPVGTFNLSQITVGGDIRAVTGEDDIHLAIRVDKLTLVKTVRIYFDVDPSVNDFTQNYYFFEWHASDLIEAIQSSNTAVVAPVRDSVPLINQATDLPTTTTPLPFGGSIEKGGRILQPPVTPVSSDPLGLGNDQWIDLVCKVKQLIHVGTETSKTLADVKRAEILISYEGPGDENIVVKYDSIYISGGYGPDVGLLGNTYRYRFSFRSSETGARSNPSPQTIYGVQAKRQRIILGADPSTDPQADLIDWWRFGGTLVRWTYVGTGPNTSADFYDDLADTVIVDGKALEFDNFQPWPTTDIARTGTCTVAGNAVVWVSGDHFNTAWAEGTAIIVNGRTYTLRQPPLSTTRILLNESAGTAGGGTVDFTVPAATLLSQPLPGLFGGPLAGTIFVFGCGDPLNPGALYWTKPNTPDMASDRNSLLVTTPSEPLQNGCFYDGLPYVFSTDHLYVIEADFNQPNQFRAQITPCGRGLWNRWGFTPTPEGIAFLAKDGIYLTRGGGIAASLTDKDLYPLFPHDGVPGVAVNGYQPPDMTQTTRLRLTYADGFLYFDYLDTLGAGRTLTLRLADGSWWPDLVAPAVVTRFWTVGSASHGLLLGGAAGTIATPGGLTDAGNAIACLATIVEAQKDARAQKLYRDVAVEADMGGVSTLSIGLSLTNGTLAYPTAALVGSAGRKPYYATLDPTGMAAYGENITLAFSFVPVSTTGPAPILYWYDIGFQHEPELSVNWLSGPTTHGLPGFQQVPLVLMAYRSSGPITFNVIIDGTLYAYALPSTGGIYLKKFFRLQSVKGLTFQYGFQASAQAAFQLFDLDCEVWVQPWGYGGNYQKMKPFSGPAIGAAGAR